MQRGNMALRKTTWTSLFMLGLLHHASGYSVMYTRMFDGQGLTVDGTFNTYEGLRRLACASACASLGSVVFSWDSSTHRCQVYTNLLATNTRLSAAGTVETYGILEDYFFTNYPAFNSMTWAQAAATCVAQGAKLALPRNHEQMKLLMQWIGHKFAFLGFYRTDGNSRTFFDVDGNLLDNSFFYWGTNEPDDPLTRGTYWTTSNGLVMILDNTRTYLPLCKPVA